MPKIPVPPQDDTLPADNSAAPAAGQPEQADGGAAFDADHAARIAQVNEGSVKNAQANWLDGMNTLLYHPDTGYLNQRGAPAVGSYGSLQDAMGKLYQQTVDNLGDDNQRGMFGRVSAPMLDAFQAQIRRHAEAQSQIYDRDASLARSAAAGNLAVNAYDTAPGADNSLYRRCLATVHNELENWFSSTHGDPAEEKNASLWEHIKQFGPDGDGGMSAIHTGIVNRLLENNQPDDARRYLDGVENSLPAPTRDKLDQFIRTGVDRQQALNAVLQAQTKSDDHAEQQQTLDGMRKSGKLGEDAYAIAQHSLQAAQQQKLAVQKQNDEQSLARVWGLKKTNPNAALTDIPASTLAYLKSRDLDKSAQAILSGHPATDDPALFNQLHRLASEDPVTFAQTSLIASSGQLSQAHMDYLQGLQDAINKQDPQAIEASKVVNGAVGIIRSGLQTMGVEANHAPDSREANALAMLESGLRDRLIAARQTKGGAPLGTEEARAIVLNYLADDALNGKGSIRLLKGAVSRRQR